MKDVFKKFNEEFWKKGVPNSLLYPINWYDKQGVMKLDDQRVVTITIDDLGHRERYYGYHVEIINKFNGTIVKKWFRFQDHLTMVHPDRKPYFHVWLNDGNFDWYISRPSDTKEMVKVICDWINQFK
jgi:hypothetical protein